MSKAGRLVPGDFTIAGRSGSKTVTANMLPDLVGSDASGDGSENAPAPDDGRADSPIMRKRGPSERERTARERAIAQDEARHSLRSLKRARQREVKFFVNVALDQATKARLKKAADENDLKMATVMKAAIDLYLSQNGY